MKKNLLTLVVLIACAGLFSGCAKSKTNDAMEPVKPVQQGKATGGMLNVEFNPAVDILFVVDNSESMKDEQEYLRKGIASFVKAFGENSSIDYRVGVITVFDSGRCGRLYNGAIKDCYPAGQLQPLKSYVEVDKLDKDGKPVLQADGKTPVKELVAKATSSAPGFVTRGEGAAEVLKATLDVGAMPLGSGGPEFEEMFMPVLAALSPAMNNGPNRGFIRGNSQVYVIFVSDENDASSISVDEFVPTAQIALSNSAQKINGSDRLSMYGVLAIDGCKLESYASRPLRIVKAVKTVGGQVFPVCNSQSFAKGLSKMGSDIREKLMKSSISLGNAVPEMNKNFKVFYGDKELVPVKDWKFNPATNMIEISNNLSVQPKPGAKFSVQFDRVSSEAIAKGRSTGIVH